jgi:hypothetical protein
MATYHNPHLQAILILTYISLAVSAVIFIFAILDRGFAALFTNMILPFLTVAYHVTILIIARYRRKKQTDATDDDAQQAHGSPRHHPTATIASLVCAYLLATAWIVPFSFLLSLGQMTGGYEVIGEIFNGNGMTLAVQFAFDAIEIGVLFAIAGISTSMRRTSGNWVRLNDDNFKLSATSRS